MPSLIDHALLRRNVRSPADLGDLNCDVFLSALNESERVRSVHAGVIAGRKIWLVHQEYGYGAGELPTEGEVFVPDDNLSEVEWWLALVDAKLGNQSLAGARVVVDITGMMRAHIMVMPLIFKELQLESLIVVYSDPTSYMSGARTVFSAGSDVEVRQVQGLEGSHLSPSPADMLVIGAGYDFGLVRAAAEAKRTCQHLVVLGLPSLQPHMYQESQLSLSDATESLNKFGDGTLLFAPADNPFATASVLQERVSEYARRSGSGNLYFCPVGSKAQVLGFAWYFLTESRHGPASMLFPFNSKYSRETSVGFSRLHEFELELNWIS